MCNSAAARGAFIDSVATLNSDLVFDSLVILPLSDFLPADGFAAGDLFPLVIAMASSSVAFRLRTPKVDPDKLFFFKKFKILVSGM